MSYFFQYLISIFEDGFNFNLFSQLKSSFHSYFSSNSGPNISFLYHSLIYLAEL